MEYAMEEETNKKGILIIILILIVLIAGIYILNDKVIRPHYYQEGYQAGVYDVIIEINQEGQIPITINETIEWINIVTICESRK